MMITVTGSDSLEVTEVVLVESSGAQEVNGSVEPLGGRSFLVRMGRVPVGDYWVRLSGVNSSRVRAAPIIYRRQSSTRVRISDFTVMVSLRVSQILLIHSSSTSSQSRETHLMVRVFVNHLTCHYCV